jgi:hypothetical protein
MRDHNPITIEEFNGWWQRGSADSTPLDHFSDCVNIQYIESGFESRAGIKADLDIGIGFTNLLKVKNYPKVSSESLLLLDTNGNIFDSGSPTPLTPILTIVGMLDFGLAFFGGRAYISPSTLVHGMAGEKVYVYLGDGTPARKAAGQPPKDADGLLAAANGGAGHVEKGIHVFAAVYETNTGFLTQIGPDTLPTVNAPGTDTVNLSNIPVSPNSYVTKVHIVATKAIDPLLYTGNTRGYQFFFVPGAIVNNGVTTLTVDFYDIELLSDASHLLDLFTEIPAGVGLTLYHGRMFDWTQEPNAEQSNILVSYPGEPEAFDQVTGIIQLAPDDYPITICQELRDVLYIFKNLKTFAVNDNGDVPSSWNVITLDQGLGCALHGIGIVLDTGGTSIDYLITVNYSGIFIFNGTFQFLELSWKLADFWNALPFAEYLHVETYIDSILKRLYIILPGQSILLFGDYQHGLDPMKLRWAPWTSDIKFSSMAITNFNDLVIVANELM